MTVLRITPNIATDDVAGVRAFYQSLFGLTCAMDQGWIATLCANAPSPTQLSIASQGGSDTAVPDISIEVDDVDAVHALATSQGHPIPYALTDEPWGVRRFYVSDPAGTLVNVMAHT